MPSKDVLCNATINEPCQWDPVESFLKSDVQNEESYQEQKLAIITCVNAIDTYKNIANQHTYTKNVGICGVPGAGKTRTMEYIVIYTIAQALICITTANMCKCALLLGGTHLHKLFLLSTNELAPPLSQAEKALTQLLKCPLLLEFIR